MFWNAASRPNSRLTNVAVKNEGCAATDTVILNFTRGQSGAFGHSYDVYTVFFFFCFTNSRTCTLTAKSQKMQPRCRVRCLKFTKPSIHPGWRSTFTRPGSYGASFYFSRNNLWGKIHNVDLVWAAHASGRLLQYLAIRWNGWPTFVVANVPLARGWLCVVKLKTLAVRFHPGLAHARMKTAASDPWRSCLGYGYLCVDLNYVQGTVQETPPSV